jgi:hypothetical protein
MLSKFIDSNIKEYYKIKSIIESCDTYEHLNVAQQCCVTFANNCEFRFKTLKKIRNHNPFKISNWKAVKRYDEMTRLQLESIMEYVNELVETLNELTEADKKKEDEKKAKPKKPKKMIGLNKLFK